MSCAVVYNSKSGNTKLVALEVADALERAGHPTEVVALTTDTADRAHDVVAAADTVLVGFWCDKGSCAAEVDELLAHLGGKRVFLFGTAGFGGSPAYFDRILSGVRAKLPEDAQYLGGAMCQGKMPASVRTRYEAMLAQSPDDPKICAMIENFDAAASHPTKDDTDAIAAAALAAVTAA